MAGAMTAPARPKRPLGRGAVAGIVTAIVLAAAAGATIASQVAVILCDGGCLTTATLAGILGGAIAGIGVAIVGLLVARAFAEWDEIRKAPDASSTGD